ncbi:lipocalin family protein [Acidobacteriota bacterium]
MKHILLIEVRWKMNPFCLLNACAVVVMLAGLITPSSAVGAGEEATMITVSSVDLQKYSGLWYEIAKIPNRFQKKCAGDTTALYSLREDGRMNVENRCLDRKGVLKTAKGVARTVDSPSNAKLKVSFVKLLGKRLFWGDYWIIGLGEQYEYAIVGHPKRKYGWILSRKPDLTEKQKVQIFSELRVQGYDPDDFEQTLHSSRSEKNSKE